MRISIRTQLGTLFILSSLISVTVVSVALFVTLQNLVLILRAQRLALTASLKATQVGTSLENMDNTVQTLSTRPWLREALQGYNAGNHSDTLIETARTDFANALTGGQQQATALQVAITAASGGSPILNVTARGTFEPAIPLPYNQADGSTIWLGQGPQGYSPALLPNITRLNDSPTVSINSRELDSQSSTLLGPLYLNDSFALFSITRALNDANSTNVLGWITVILDGRSILSAVRSHVGLSRTGTSLVIAPYSVDNRFPPSPDGNDSLLSSGTRLFSNITELNSLVVHRVLPASQFLQGPRQHQGPADAPAAPPFKAASDQTLRMALGRNLSTVNNAGGVTLLHNQAGAGISVGFALVNTSLCDWIYQVEYSDTEILAASHKLTKAILICIFSTIALMLCLVVPVTGLWSRPVIRLRNATADSIRPANLKSGTSTKSSVETLIMDDELNHTKIITTSSGVLEKTQVVAHGLGSRKRHDTTQSNKSSKGFRIPGRVKERRCCVEDEMTDLTRVFNQMSEELEKQYASLEERVKQRTYELEVSKKAAESANESKSLFIANISHELKTPLNGILGMTDVCLQENDPTRIKESLRMISRSGDLLHNLLTDLLSFSKNQAGQALALDEKRFRLGDIAAQIRAIFGNQAHHSGVDLQITYVPPVPSSEATPIGEPQTKAKRMKNTMVFGDPSRILQVVINLVGNSLKFTPRGGKVDLIIRQLHEPAMPDQWDSLVADRELDSWSKYAKDLVSEEEDSDLDYPRDTSPVEFEFEVQDTGPGIEKALQEQIFKPFVQGDVSLARKHGGTGLGLSICSQLAELMAGQISLKSEMGHGSKFTMNLPLHIIKEGQEDIDSASVTVVSSVSPTIASVTEHDKIAPALLSQGDILLPESRRESVVPPDLSKTRLVGLSQPYFSIATPPALTPIEESPPKRKQSLKVLVAEDNYTNQQVVLRMLRLEDILNVRIAEDGQEALERVQESMAAKSPYDLILMDVQMPRLDGRRATRLIRQAGFSAPVVALTAFADEKNEQECFEAGMDFFLEKPIRRKELQRVLKRYSNDNNSLKSYVSTSDKASVSYFGPTA